MSTADFFHRPIETPMEDIGRPHRRIGAKATRVPDEPSIVWKKDENRPSAAPEPRTHDEENPKAEK
jgi:hypothetical protein